MDSDAGDHRGGTVASDLGVLHRLLLAVIAVLVVVVGVARLFDWQVITRVHHDWPMIFPYTVAGVAALLGAMILFDRGGRGGRIIGRVLAGATLLLGAGVDLGVSAGILPVADPTAVRATWAMVLPSLGTIAVSTSILMLSSTRDRWPLLRFWLAMFGGFVALLALLSYVYGSTSLFSSMGMTGTSMPASILGLLIVAAALTARPDRPPLARLDEHYDSTVLRRLLPPLIAVPFLPAFIEWTVTRFDSEDESAEAVSYLLTVVILIAIIVIAGGSLSRTRHALASERQRLWDAFASTPAATAMLDLDGRLMLANTAMARLLATTESQLLGRALVDVVADHDKDAVRAGLASMSSDRETVRLDVQLQRPDGSLVWVDLGVAPVRDVAGQVTFVVAQCSDLTDRKHLERVLSERATRDTLTGLLNREGLSNELRARSSAPPRGFVTAVVYADVDGLKAVNDSIGHAAGDDMLREVASRLSGSTREGDILARVGGDEFVLITTLSATGQDPAATIVGRLRSELSGPINAGGEIVNLSVSLGAAVLDTGSDVAAAVARADKAMYSDKRRRRLPDAH